jgi:lysophospholipase L1-like esterase
LIVLEGINDIGNCGNIGSFVAWGGQAGPVTADDLIAAYKQIIERAHRHGVKVIGGTLTPFAGAYYYSKDKEATRQGVNRWIRTSKAFDAVVDFDAAIRDPQHPEQIRPEYNDGDHLHPNDAGYKAMADAVDPSIFK